MRGYGNLIIIKHNKEFLSAYAFNQRNLTKEGMKVQAGQKIATMGRDNAGTVLLLALALALAFFGALIPLTLVFLTGAAALHTIDPTQIYLRELGFKGLLTAKEEVRLARRVQRNDPQARTVMIESNLRLVVKTNIINRLID